MQPASWIERWAQARSRLVARPGFRDWAIASPLTRWIARRRARALFDLCAGFVYSQVLLACVRLRVCEILLDAPLDPEELASRLGLPRDPVVRLLSAAAALGILGRRAGGRYGLGPLGEALVDAPGIVAMIEHHSMLYADLSDPLALLRGERDRLALEAYWPYARASDPRSVPAERVRAYTALMAASQRAIAGEVLAAYPLGRHRRLLDVGGGSGTFLLAVAARAPQLELRLFDLPAVAGIARAALAEAGLDGRAEAIGGDFFRDPLPPGADLITLVRVLHDHDDERVAALLRSARAALAPGGRLLIAEPLAGEAGAERVGDAYFNFYLLAMGSGRARSFAELSALVRAAGFAPPRRLATRLPMLTSVLVACVR